MQGYWGSHNEGETERLTRENYFFVCLFFFCFFFRILLNERKKEEESEIILRENSSVDSRPDVVCRATPPISCSGSSFFAFFITKPFIVLPFSSTLSLLSLASASIFLVTLFHHRINHIWSVDESEMPGFWHHQNASSLLKKNTLYTTGRPVNY